MRIFTCIEFPLPSCYNLMCVLLKGDEPEKELPPAPPVTTKKQPPAQVPAAAVQPVKAAAVEVSVLHPSHWHSVSAQAYGGELYWHECSKGLLAKPITIHFLTGQKRATSEGKGFPESLCHTSAAETKWGWSRCQAEQPFCSNTTKWVFEPLAVLKLIDILDKCRLQWHVG